MTSTGIVFVILVSSAAILISTAVLADRRFSQSLLRKEQMDSKKRPFCNAFAGCGRKRSVIPSLESNMQMDDVKGEDSISTLVELNSEPAVEDLSRQIMSEAKLWEAIQEANQELIRRRQDAAEEGNALAGFGAGGKCGSSTCFI